MDEALTMSRKRDITHSLIQGNSQTQKTSNPIGQIKKEPKLKKDLPPSLTKESEETITNENKGPLILPPPPPES